MLGPRVTSVTLQHTVLQTCRPASSLEQPILLEHGVVSRNVLPVAAAPLLDCPWLADATIDGVSGADGRLRDSWPELCKNSLASLVMLPTSGIESAYQTHVWQ